MSNQLTREGPYASASVVNTGGTDFNGDLEAGPPPEARPRSAQERRRVSGASRSELGGARSQAVSERPQSTTVSKITKSRSLTSRNVAANGLAVRPDRVGTGARSVHSVATTRTNKTNKSGASSRVNPNSSTTKAGVVVETMSAPNPFCPNTKGICCLMILVNLGLILICIGFIIVLQLPEPAFVWNIGIVILVFGFIAIFVSLLYCMCICQEGKVYGQHGRGGSPQQPELFWTHHWQKNITIPDIKSKEKADDWDQERFPNDDLSDTSSRDYPRLYLDSDYGQRTDRENDVETEHEMERPPMAPSRASRQNQQH